VRGRGPDRGRGMEMGSLCKAGGSMALRLGNDMHSVCWKSKLGESPNRLNADSQI
jgi:hypothetical protein